MVSSISGVAAGISPQVVSGASMRMPMAQRLSNLFDKIDTSGSGSITKAQFEQAFQNLNPPKGLQAMGADAIWNQLDPNSTGSVSKQDFVNVMSNVLTQMHAQHGAGQAADADGDADGSTVAQSGSSSAVNDLATALQNLEATLNGQAGNSQSGTTGTLINTKA